MHVCKDCGETDITKFGIRSTSKKPYNYCRPCRNNRNRETSKTYYSSEKGKSIKAASDKKYYEANKDKIAEYNKTYRINNAEMIQNYKREVYLKNKKQILNSLAKYKKNNKDKVNKLCANRRARKLRSAPNWGELDNFIIEEAYSLAKQRSELTNIKWHCDHIIPLNNKKVCGLHVGINLQVIPAIDNLRKSNTFKL